MIEFLILKIFDSDTPTRNRKLVRVIDQCIAPDSTGHCGYKRCSFATSILRLMERHLALWC